MTVCLAARYIHIVDGHYIDIYVVVYTDLLAKELYRGVGIYRVLSAGNLGGVMVSTLVQKAEGEGSNPAVGAI